MTGPAENVTSSPRPIARQILSLAIPAFGALLAEPLFLLADTAIIGHLGVAELAGVGLATTALHTATGLLIFLAYSTTPAVARFLGAGRIADALGRGRDGIWLGLAIGVVVALAGWFAAPGLTALLGAAEAGPAVHDHAVAYLRWSMPGLPAMLAVLAATGVLRGLQDTRTPLVVAGVGFGVNIVANFVLVYGLGWGVAGSAAGTSVIQWAMLGAYVFVLAPRFRSAAISWAPTWWGMRATVSFGSWLLLRNATMRLAILATVMMAASLGTDVLAAHQIVFIIYSTLAFALDALAIAAQALIGRELGASNVAATRELTATMIRWALWFGVGTGVLMAGLAWVVPHLFTSDAEVAAATTSGLLVLAATQPLAGYVFVLDGVLMGAGDARYLGLAGVFNVIIYLPCLYVLVHLLDQTATHPGWGVAAVWMGFAGVYLGARGLTLGWRARQDTWMRLGAH